MEVCISGWNSTCQPYIDSTTVLSNNIKKGDVGMAKHFSKKYGNKG